MDPIVVTPRLVLPASELRYVAVRASGPGGQNVNKVASKIELLFNARGSSVLDAGTRARLLALGGKRVDNDGWLHLVSQESRDQPKNLEAARAKLAELVRTALVPPKPRRPTKPTRGSKERRLAAKRQTSERKASRRDRDD